MIRRSFNVIDRQHDWIGAWETAPLVYDALTKADIGRRVIYHSHGIYNEVGVITSFRGNVVFARFTRGPTSAGCKPEDLCFGLRPLDGRLDR
jgi:hypothetical protein